ncbi:hypothetical protein [Pseudomonas syringae]|uniref:hypothetical protein n=1 Tax=Pseudomonas syringae TaxID=317 RepID=UPI003F7738D5
MSILSFFPLAFLLTEKGKGIFPAGAEKLELSDESLLVGLSALNVNCSGQLIPDTTLSFFSA